MSDIVNVGICTVDAIARTVDEMPPRGGLRLFDSLTLTTGGNAVNCSIALAKLGVACDLIVKVGADTLGDFILAEAKRYGVGTAGVVRDEHTHTPFTFVCSHTDGQRSFIHTIGTNGTFRAGDVDLTIIKRAKFCFVTGTMIMTAFDGQETADVLAAAREFGCVTLLDTVFVDTASQEQWRAVIDPTLEHLDYFIPSLLEAKAITGMSDPSEMARDIQNHGCRNVIIKLDIDGAFVRTADGVEQRVPAYYVDRVVDTTGAGDCWSAGFLTGLRAGEAIADAARLGNAVAAHGIGSPGAATGIVTLDRVREFQKSTPLRT